MSRRSPRWMHIVGAVPGLALLALSALAIPAWALRELAAFGDVRFSSLGDAIDTAGDFNGDGYVDFMYGYATDGFGNFDGQLFLFLGSPTADFPRLTFLPHEPGTGFGFAVSHAGDLNDDGLSDIIAAAYTGPVSVFLGGSPPDTTADLVVTIPSTAFGPVLGSAGDLNADGYDDFVVAEPRDGGGRAFVYFGGSALEGTPDFTLDGAAGDAFGTSVAGGRDLNGDGYDDLVVGAPAADGPGLADAGIVYVFFGGPSVDAIPDLILHGAGAGARLGNSVALLADFDGDGASDLVVGAADNVSLFRGGVGLDSQPDWSTRSGVVYGNLGASVSAGDDVNRDHFSDVIASGPTEAEFRVFFGGAAADTVADIEGNVGSSSYPANSRVAGVGDVDGDGYQEWLAARLGCCGMGNFRGLILYTAHGDLRISELSRSILGGASMLISWTGADVADLSLTRDGTTWQTLATGLGGAPTNSASIVIPAGRTPRALLRLASTTGDSVLSFSNPFAIRDSVQTDCVGAGRMAGGVGVTWRAVWAGYVGAVPRYRLYRSEPGAMEVRVGPDAIVEEGYYDPAGSGTSTYRLAALLPGDVERDLGSVMTDAMTCDSVRIVFPNGGEDFHPHYESIRWKQSRASEIQVSLDGGITWTTVHPRVPVDPYDPRALIQLGVPIDDRTVTARIRARLLDVGGALWDESDHTFSVDLAIQVARFSAEPADGDAGVILRWSTSPGITNPGLIGYRICREAPGGQCTTIGTGMTSGSIVLDREGTAQSTYQLWAIVSGGDERFLATTTVSPGSRATLLLAPSPTSRSAAMTIVVPALVAAQGAGASDVEVTVHDLSGRRVAQIARAVGPGAAILHWAPADAGLRAGIYFLRVRSQAAAYKASLRFVVID